MKILFFDHLLFHDTAPAHENHVLQSKLNGLCAEIGFSWYFVVRSSNQKNILNHK